MFIQNIGRYIKYAKMAKISDKTNYSWDKFITGHYLK